MVLFACSPEPTGPDDRTPLDPPSAYLGYWGYVEACSGRRGSFDRVHWFVTDGFEDPDVQGQWNSRHEITLRRDSVDEPLVVEHEILHDLLDGDGDHSDDAWDACDLPKGVG